MTGLSEFVRGMSATRSRIAALETERQILFDNHDARTCVGLRASVYQQSIRERRIDEIDRELAGVGFS